MPGAYGALGTVRRELKSSKKRLELEQDRFERLQKAEQILSTEAANGNGVGPTNGRRRARGRPRGIRGRRTKRSRATTTA